MKNLITITTEHHLGNTSFSSDGIYEIEKHGTSFKYEGTLYTYLSSGLARCVYKSECGKFVIKVPQGSYYVDTPDEIREYILTGLKNADHTISHNYGEAKAYEECPNEFKHFLAKSELLPNCWVKQEFVEVLNCSFTGRHDLREIGRRDDGSICIFDFDPLLDNFEFDGFNWDRLPTIISDIQKKL